MQAILKKLTKLILRQNKPINNNSPRRVIPDTRKLFWNDSTRGNIIMRRTAIIIAFLALTVNGLVYFSDQAFAEAGASFTFTVNVPSDPLLEIRLFDGDGTTSLQNAVSMNVVPGYYSAGFNEQDVTIKVATNNTWGYNLVMNVANTALTSGSNTIANLATKTGGYTCTRETAATCDFTANSWGYKIKTATSDQAATNYIPVPTSITLNHNGQASDGGAATGGTTELAFASRINAQQAPGAYSTTINFVATANPNPCNGEMLGGTCITSMQDFGDLDAVALAAVKNAMIEDEQYQFKDSRDDKLYWVAKLKDGNVWMTQNLDFNIDSTKTYTPEDTDISANWTPTSSTYATGSTSWDWSYTTPESYDPGNRCWNGTLDTSWGGNLGNMTETCSEGSHYQIGNYYNWTAAVAMNDSSSHSTNYEDVNQSICPAGWRLPTYSGDKSYANLISEIGNVTSGTSGNIQNNPLYFAYGGYWDGSSYDVGSYGYYWSSVVGDGDLSYYLGFSVGGNLHPQVNYDRASGFSVRCVAR